MTISYRWEQPPTVWTDGTEAYIQAIWEAILAVCHRRAPEIQNWMRSNAPWTDRTGNARQGLNTQVEAAIEGDYIALIFAHGVFYGIFLELRNSGRYAVVNPALDYWGPIIWQDVLAVMRS
jgi:hypothetical protein